MIEVGTLKVEGLATGLRFSPDGQSLCAFDGVCFYLSSFDGSAFVERQRFKVPAVGKESGVYVAAGRFLRDSESIMLISSVPEIEQGIHHVEVRHVPSFQLKSTADFQLESYGLLGLMFNRAEDGLLVMDCSGSCNFLAFPSCQLLWSAKGLLGRGSVYSPDGAEIWTTDGEDEPNGYRDYLNALDPQSGKRLRRCRLQEEQFYYGLRLSPDERFLVVVGEQSISVVDPKAWKLLKVVTVRENGHLCQPTVEFSPDGRLMALGCDADYGVFVFDCKTWELIATLPEKEPFAVRSLAFSPDGTFLACGSWNYGDGIKVWRVSPRRRRTSRSI